MNNKIKELMELSKAVDVVVKSVEKENEEKRKVLDQKLSEKWDAIWDDIDMIMEALKTIKIPYGHRRDLKYDLGYPLGFDYLSGGQGITFIATCNDTKLMMDRNGGWQEVTRKGSHGFDYWRTICPAMVEALVSKWGEILPKIEKDVEELLNEDIKRRAKECADKTEELDRKLIAYD